MIEGTDAVTEIPEDRFNKAYFFHPKIEEPGKTYTFAAGVVDSICDFDAGFFGISPREAAQMDPQQRILLEVAWEALENSGIPSGNLAGKNVGFYLGMSATDYAILRADDPASQGPQTMIGNTASVTANRVSYFFDWHGPSMAIDTACSSSLVAFNQACIALRDPGIPAVLVGGVNALLCPNSFVGFSKASMLSPDGRCKAFDAGGRGYVRAEGCVVVVLKRLENALRDGDRILGVVAGSGTNCDGATDGLSFPGSESQSALLRQVYEQAGIGPDQIAYIEAHGTGTAAGDPVETKALGELIGSARAAIGPLPIGSIKTNIGHLEPASGLAGLLKALLVLNKGKIPPSLHFTTPNPKIDFAGWNLRVVTKTEPFGNVTGEPAVGVNSFGVGGANAHVVLQKAPNLESTGPVFYPHRHPPLVISAKSSEALKEAALRYSRMLSGDPDAREYYDIAWNAAHKREWLSERLFVDVESVGISGTSAALQHFADSATATGVTIASNSNSGPVALVFSGNGCQWAGMAREWMDGCPEFERTILLADPFIEKFCGWKASEYLRRPACEQQIEQTSISQPLLFVIQAAMTDLLLGRGLPVAATFGHSVGEIAAAYAAGGLTLEQACQVICERSRCQEVARNTGAMAAVGLPPEETLLLLKTSGLQLEISAINSPKAVTVAGTHEAVDRLGVLLESRGVFFRKLPLDYAFHSAFMDPVEQPLKQALSDLVPRTSKFPFISTVTGDVLDTDLLLAEYWWHNVRDPVLFAAAAETAIGMGVKHFLEIGPHCIFRHSLTETLETHSHKGQVLLSARKDLPQIETFERAIASAFLLAGPDSLQSFFPVKGNMVDLPNYPWQHERYWYPQTREGLPRIHDREVHPLLGTRIQDEPATWEKHIELSLQTWLRDHKAGKTVLFPAAGYIEMFLAAAAEVAKERAMLVRNMEIRRPMALHDGEGRCVRLRFLDDEKSMVIESRTRLGEDDWTRHAVATLVPDCVPPEALPAPQSACEKSVSANEHQEAARQMGLEYGPAFQPVESAGIFGSTIEGSLVIPEAAKAAMEGMIAPPVLVDGAFQLLIDLLKHLEGYDDHATPAYLASRMGTIRCEPAGELPVSARTVWRKTAARSILADVDLLDRNGFAVIRLRDCRFQRAPLQSQSHWSQMVMEWKWVPAGGAFKVPVLPDFHSDRSLHETQTRLLEAVQRGESAAFVKEVLHSHPRWLPALLPILGGCARSSEARPQWLETCLDSVPEISSAQAWLADFIQRGASGRLRILLLAPESPGLIQVLSDALPPESAEIVIAHPDHSEFEQMRTEMSGNSRLRFVAWDETEAVDIAVCAWLHPAVASDARFWREMSAFLKPHARFYFALEPSDSVLPKLLLPQGAGNDHLSLEGMQIKALGQSGMLDLFTFENSANAAAPQIDGAAFCWIGMHHPLLDALRGIGCTISDARALPANFTRQPSIYAASLDSGCAPQEALADYLEWIQRIPAGTLAEGIEIIVLTTGAWSSNPAQAAFFGMNRVLSNEFPKSRFRTVDFEPDLDLVKLAEALLNFSDESELRIAAGGVLVGRMTKCPPAPLDGSGFKLDTPSPGLLDRIEWQEIPALETPPDGVGVAVRAAGLNFRDVMWAMGLLPDEALEAGFAGPTLGLEFSGIVGSVGENVSILKPGDAVMGFGPACFGKEVTTTGSAVVRIPDQLGFDEAAAIPSTFFTAYYSLVHLAGLCPGEKVLIHGAAGGVGLAALQIAQNAGAEIFATAGSEAKRSLLKALGAHHVLNSRDLSFADEIRHLTNGQGVDVVLNSLAGDSMQASIDLLAPYGRFLELGKRDFYANSKMSMRALRNNIAYHGVDADQLMVSRPALCARLFEELMEAFREGKLHPIPVEKYPRSRVVDAFRQMQQSRHIGKIVVDMSEETPPPVVPRSARFACRPDRAYLVTGGLAGFGLESARWLAKCGARHLVLAGRRGLDTPGAAEAVASLGSLGAKVEVVAADVSVEEDVRRMLCPQGDRPPLAGIIHAAAVFDDRLAVNIDRDSIRRVFAPKAGGALLIDRLSRSLNLDWLVLYSSATTFIGNPGQANYVAANSVLEALAETRTAQGLPTLAVAWGAIDDAGHLTRHEEIKSILASRLGREVLPATKALFTMGQLLARGISGTRAILPLDWPTLRKNLPITNLRVYDWMNSASGAESENDSEAADFQSLAMELDADALQALVRETLTGLLAHILRLAPEKIDPARPVAEMGMDSLMTLEMGIAIENHFGVQPSALHLSSTITLRGMADSILKEIRNARHVQAFEPDEIGKQLEAIAATHGVEIEKDVLGSLAAELREEAVSGGTKTWATGNQAGS